MLSREQLIEVLKKCFDPELNLDVWTLGLIYDVKIEDARVDIRMTFTTPMCPYGPWLVNSVQEQVKQAGVPTVNVEVVFDPPWQPSDEIKLMLGIQ